MSTRLALSLWLILLVLALSVSYDMFQLTEAKELWGYRPLTLLLSVWGAVVLGRIWWRRWRGRDVRWNWLGWSTLSGVLLGVGFPDLIPFPLLMFVAWVPLLLLEKQLVVEPKKTYALAFRYGMHTFLLWNIIATYWVANTALAAGIFAIIANSLLMAIPWVLFHWVHRNAPKVAYPALISFWFCFDYTHLHWDLSWPWLMLGNSLAEWPWAVQWYEWTGVFGGSLWIWAVNLLVMKAVAQKQMKPLYWALGVLLVPLIGSVIRYTSYSAQGDTVEVVVVQPNFEPHYEKFDQERFPESVQLERFIELSTPQLTANTNYLVFPETSFGFVEESQIGRYPTFRALADRLMEYPTVQLVSGINLWRDFGAQPGPSSALRERRSAGGQTLYYDQSNAAVQIPIAAPDGYQVYRKGKLVPGPEIFPFKDLFFFMEPLIDKLDGTTAGLATQPAVTNFTSDAAHIAPVICYESVFGEYFASYVSAGAQAAFIMTNDGWWANTGGHRQHLYFASLRAIESRRAIARSANTGISAFINQRGDIRQATRYAEATAIRSDVQLNDALTFYVKRGDYLARVALVLAVLILLSTFVQSVVRKGEKRNEVKTGADRS